MPANSTRIRVRRRHDDWHASIPGQAGYWGVGSTPAEALGNLLYAYPEAFGIALEIESLGFGFGVETGPTAGQEVRGA